MAATSPLLLLSLFMLSVLRFGDTKTQLISVIEALEKLVGFYRSSYQGFNVDGLFGLRVVEGQVQLLLQEYNKGDHPHVSPNVVDRLRQLVKEATTVCNQALEYVRKDDENYYNNFQFLIGSPWAVYKKHRGIDPNLKWLPAIYKAQKHEKLDEELSDWCMGELTGASHKYGRSCVISDRCVKTMTQRGYTEYSLTHQLLWTMVAEKAGCMQELKQSVSTQGFVNVEQLQLEFCTNNYYEMLAVVHIYMQGVIKEGYQDLFLEQQFVCPSIGFYEHLTGDYLQQILSWQKKSGCYGESKSHKRKINRNKANAKETYSASSTAKYLQESNNLSLSGRIANQNLSNPLHFHSQEGRLQKSILDLNIPQQKQLNIMNANPISQRENLQAVPHQGSQQYQQQHPIIRQKKTANLQMNPVVERQKNTTNLQMNPIIERQKPAAHGNNMAAPLPGLVNGALKQASGKNEGVLNNLQNKKLGTPFIQQVNNNVPQSNMNERKFNQNEPYLPKESGNMVQQNAPVDLFGKMKRPYTAPQNMGRRLLVEKRMEDGCFSHKTAVAAGALVMYLRYLIDPGPLDLNATHRVLPESSRSLLENPDISLGDSQKVKKEGLIPVKDHLDEDELAINMMAPALEDREGGDFGPDGDGGNAGEEEEEDYDGGDEEEEGEEEEDEEDLGDDDGYEDKDMYPDKAEDIQDRKIVHFGADRERLHRLANIGDGLIDHMKGGKGDLQGNEDVEYTYYEENEKEDKNIINEETGKKDTHVVKSHHRSKSHNQEKHLPGDKLEAKVRQEPLEKTMFVVFSACFLLLFFLMYRFIKKRRIHIRYHPRTVFM